MGFINNMKIGLRLNIILSLVMVIIVSSLGIYVMQITKQNSINEADKQLTEQVSDLSTIIELQITERQVQINSDIEIILSNIEHIGGIKIEEESGKWLLEGEKISENFDFVDEMSRITNGVTVSFFRKNSEGFKRISTSIKNSNGIRELGSVISTNSEVYQDVINGKKFHGRNNIFNEWYITTYAPIYVNNHIEGMIGIGVREKDMDELRKIFKGKTYFKTGYPFLAESFGIAVIHPTIEGQDLSGSEVFKLITRNKSEEIFKNSYLWEGDQKILYSKYIPIIDSYVAIGVTQKEFLDAVNKTKLAIIVAVLIGILFFILVNSLISRNITRSLNKGVELASKIAGGDLRNTLDIDQKDEIGDLARALNEMVGNLKNIALSITEGANNVASASQQVGSATQQLSQGASEQASSAEEVSSSMEEMASNIQQNTDNSQQTEKIAINAAEGIGKVASAAQESLTSIRQISEKITIINDIAFQTNILALNAAVEAARAGEHGKGFAVVAAEVRKLAERSKVAADEINNLSKHSLQTTEDAGVLVNDIIPEIEKTAKLVQEISAASLEQNAGSDQINGAIQQLSQVTQQNAAASEEMATSSEELASQADQLRETISYFIIDDKSKFNNKNNNSLKQFVPEKKLKTNNLNKQNKQDNGVQIKLNENDTLDNEFESF